MPRNRLLKREFFRDEKVAALSLGGRLQFQSMWCEADDSGNGRADARLLKAEAFPYDDFPATQVEGWLQEIVTQGMVRLYEAGGTRYFNIVNFLKHQTIDRPSKFRHPAPPLLDESSPKARRTLDECSPTKVKGNVKGKAKGEGKPSRSADALAADRDSGFENLKTPENDLRFEALKSFYVSEFEKRNPGVKAPLDGSDGKALKALLGRQEHLPAETIISWLRNAFESDDVPPLRPGFRLRAFCNHAAEFASGPLRRQKRQDRTAKIGDGGQDKFAEAIL